MKVANPRGSKPTSPTIPSRPAGFNRKGTDLEKTLGGGGGGGGLTAAAAGAAAAGAAAAGAAAGGAAAGGAAGLPSA